LTDCSLKKSQNFANWPVKFGKIFHGKPWALKISSAQCSEKSTHYVSFYISMENIQIFIKFSANV